MRGLSLIELLATLAIAGLLAAIALPGYSHVVTRATRQDARLSLLRAHHRMEVVFANHLSYAAPGGDATTLAIPGRSEQGHYIMELQVAADGLSYVVLARADPAGRQAADAPCRLLAIDETGRRRSADASGNWRDDDPRCWG
jgi:type IV pilus assembly protein PilE